MNSAVIVHGGAGAWKLDSGRLNDVLAACAEAASEAQNLLNSDHAALDAVEAAVRILEDCPFTDAGRGSYLTVEGTVEMDAIIMDGEMLNLGAVGAIQRVRNPISLARIIMLDCEHAFLVGEGASRFADRVGFPRCETEELVTGDELLRYRAVMANRRYETKQVFTEPDSMGTVGAVALDRHGNVAAATSTGGTRKKLSGRLGDSPLVGSGAYADNWVGAASATGHGEALMKVVISKRVCDLMASGLTPAAACRAAIEFLGERVDGNGGVIAVDRNGRVGFSFNTVAMPYAFAVGSEPVVRGR